MDWTRVITEPVGLVVSSPGEFHPEALAEPDVRLAPHPAAGSAGGISPPAAHRTVRKSLDLHGSSQPFTCHLTMTSRRGRSMLIPVARLPGCPVGDSLL